VYEQHGAYTVSVSESGPLRKTIRVVRTVHLAAGQPETLFVQDVSLYANSPLLYVEMHGNWHAVDVCVKAEFDLAMSYDTVSCEMPYGVINRPAVYPRARRQEKADGPDEPDRPMQNWIDVSDGTNGLAVINNGKYGYSSTASTIALTLMRAPRIREGEVAGLGPFEFAYGVLPHAGTWVDAGIPAAASIFNRPVRSATTFPHHGEIDAGSSLFQVDDPSVLIAAVKKAESNGDIVLRLFQSTGRPAEVKLRSHFPVSGAKEVDGLEDDVAGSRVRMVDDRTVAFNCRAFEIVSIRLRFPARQ
jgi:alpha-mannosidase